LAAVASVLCAWQEGGRTAAAAPADPPIVASSREFCAAREQGRVVLADPSNYRALIAKLTGGQTLLLAPGEYPRLVIANVHGDPGRCITITGPTGTRQATVLGEIGNSTVEIINSSYVILRNLVIDSRGVPAADGIKAPAAMQGATHHVVLEGNLIIGAGASQQADGISTKTPTWNWIIRRNTIVGAGTGMYLGDSDGTAPFIAGLIENNLVLDPIGYGMQIKFQVGRPVLPGIPEGPQSTIIRNNTFKKSGRPSPDGDRPNLLVGGFPDSGTGSGDLYEIYGNLLVDNPREALFQGSGRISFHDNLLIGGHPAAAVFRDHDLPLKLAEVFDNKIYSPEIGIQFGSPARAGHSVFGNIIFAAVPIAGLDKSERDNLVFVTPRAPGLSDATVTNRSAPNREAQPPLLNNEP
jgi:hypothetical protein